MWFCRNHNEEEQERSGMAGNEIEVPGGEKGEKRKKKFLPFIFIVLIVLCVIASVSANPLHLKELLARYGQNNRDGGQEAGHGELTALAKECAEATQDFTAKQEAESETADEKAEEQEENSIREPPSHKEPLTAQAVYPTDIYIAPGRTAVFRCYYPSAEGYQWEKYETSKMEWTPIEDADVYAMQDELYRTVSCCNVNADSEQTIRCTIKIPEQEGDEDIVKTAKLIPLSQEITDIVPAASEFQAGMYLSSLAYPVKVIYADGTEEEISGLYDLYFMEQKSENEFSESEYGQQVEKITYTRTECSYSYIDCGEKELSLRYRKEDGENLEKQITVSGIDKKAPDILDLTISEFEVRNTDEPVQVTISIAAEDDYTPYPELVYAFLRDGAEPTEEDWTTKPEFDAIIDRNGTWTAYCMDSSGNISMEKREIIAVDQKAPVIEVKLENETWCTKNKIIVNAKDQLSMSYLYRCPETGEDSGWISLYEYDISNNGTWTVMVRDAVGNTAETKITVSNIDKEPPIINSITVVNEQSEEGDYENE